MKRYLPSLFGIAFAIGFTSFVSPKLVRPVKQADYIWYYVEDGLTTDVLVFGDTCPRSKSAAKEETGCTDYHGGHISAAGFTNTILEGIPVTSLSAERLIRCEY